MEKFCDVILARFIGDAIMMTSYLFFLKFDLVIISLKNQFGQIMQLQVTNIEG